MIDVIYYDCFENGYVLEPEETIVPPERYIQTLRNELGIYIETFSVGKNHLLDIAYSEEDYQCGSTVYKIRKAMEEKHNCSLSRIVRWSIPSHKFDEYVERFNIAGE